MQSLFCSKILDERNRWEVSRRECASLTCKAMSVLSHGFSCKREIVRSLPGEYSLWTGSLDEDGARREPEERGDKREEGRESGEMPTYTHPIPLLDLSIRGQTFNFRPGGEGGRLQQRTFWVSDSRYLWWIITVKCYFCWKRIANSHL